MPLGAKSTLCLSRGLPYRFFCSSERFPPITSCVAHSSPRSGGFFSRIRGQSEFRKLKCFGLVTFKAWLGVLYPPAGLECTFLQAALMQRHRWEKFQSPKQYGVFSRTMVFRLTHGSLFSVGPGIILPSKLINHTIAILQARGAENRQLPRTGHTTVEGAWAKLEIHGPGRF